VGVGVCILVATMACIGQPDRKYNKLVAESIDGMSQDK
jgi:hypothetical protein